MQVVTPGHGPASWRAAVISARKASKWWSESCGPGALSGWYCTAKARSAGAARPSQQPSLRLTSVTSHAGRQARGVDREAVVVRRDLHAAAAGRAHRLVAAAMAELELVGAGAEREGEDLVAEADAEDRHPAQQFAHRVDGVGHGRRDRPGRCSGRRRRAPARAPSRAGVSAGTTVMRQPRAASRRRMLRLIPKS